MTISCAVFLLFAVVLTGVCGSTRFSATPSENNWFPDKYLPAIKTASGTYGKPLVDVYDFHWFRSYWWHNSGDQSAGADTDRRAGASDRAKPAVLFDTTYKENSWITNDVLGGPIYILSRLQSRIASENPGMKISITEYNNGGGLHIAGTIAQADNLGIFGAQGLFAASLWPLSSNEPYTLAGFRAYRDFAGWNQILVTFGWVQVPAMCRMS
jgi:hypothetical protein